MFADNELSYSLKDTQWVGMPVSEVQCAGNTLVYFQTSFELESLPQLTLQLSANHRYKLYINGQFVESGPCKGDRFRQFFDTLVVSSYLKIGINVIAVEVLYFNQSLYRHRKKTGPMSIVGNSFGPLLALKGCVVNQEGETLCSVTTGLAEWFYAVDQSICWDVFQDGDCFMPVGAFEVLDCTKVPINWKIKPCNGIFATAVAHFEAGGSAWGEFPPLPPRKRSIPFLTRENLHFNRVMSTNMMIKEQENSCEGFYAIIPEHTKQFVELDAGELITGYVRLVIAGGAGAKVTLTYAESYSMPGSIQYRVKDIRDDLTQKELFGYCDVLLTSKEAFQYEPFWWRTFRFVRLEIETAEAPLKVSVAGFISLGYPLEEKTFLQCSEPWVMSLWDMSVRTLKRCMHETYEDCPYYEQIQYALDTRQEILFTHLVSGDTRLGLKAVEDFYCSRTPEGLLNSRAPADEPNIIPVFSLYWIFMLEDYYQQTGEVQFLKRYMNAVDEILEWFNSQLSSSGLVEALYYWEFVDWVEKWQDERGFVTGIPDAAKRGPCTCTNLLYVMGLQCGARLMGLVGRSELGNDYATRAEQILKQVDQLCWCPEMGMFQEGPGVLEFTHHAQALAVLTGLVKDEHAVTVLKNSLNSKTALECTYVFSYFQFRAFEKAGIYHLTLPLWNKWKAMLPFHVTTWPEDTTRQRSDCHAWGSLPIYEFVRCFLGIQPDLPGWERLIIAPKIGDIKAMSGQVVTPKGMVEVGYCMDQSQMIIEGQVPKGVPFVVILPNGEVHRFDQGGDFRVISK